MTYDESSEGDDDDDEGTPDDVLLSNMKLLEFMKFKDKYNITDEAVRILNQLESIHSSCPTLYHLKKLRTTLNKNIPIKKCDQGEFREVSKNTLLGQSLFSIIEYFLVQYNFVLYTLYI